MPKNNKTDNNEPKNKDKKTVEGAWVQKIKVKNGSDMDCQPFPEVLNLENS